MRNNILPGTRFILNYFLDYNDFLSRLDKIKKNGLAYNSDWSCNPATIIVFFDLKRTIGMKKDSLLLIIGQSLMLIGFSTFIINYFFLNNNPVLVFVIILIFVLSLILNLRYLIRELKETK